MLKKSKLLLALSLILCFGCFAISVFAEAEEPTAAKTSTAAITKLLKVGHGTTVPNATFNFTVSSVSVDGDENISAPTSDIGDNGVVSINFPPAGASPAYTYKETINNIDYYYLESAELFGSVDWPNAGLYEYRIVETGSVYSLEPGETMTLSQAVYSVVVYVDECKNADCHDGHTLGELYIDYIGVLKTVNDDGEDIDEQDEEKVDPTPGGGDLYDYSQLVFTNEFWKTTGPTDPKNGESTLAVSKEVAGSNASTTMYFEFKMTVTVPDLEDVPNTYKAYVIEEDPDNSGKYLVVTASANYSGSIGMDGAIAVTPENELTFKLKHNQMLVFEDLPVGASYVLKETETPGYTPKVKVEYDDLTSVSDNTSASFGMSYSLPSDTIDSTYLFVSEDGSRTSFTNDRGEITPTGLNMNDLPFYGLILLALGAFIIFIVAKSRKRKDYDA